MDKTRVQCFLCQHEEDGFCSKKTKNLKPAKVKVKKKRSCSLYLHDPFKILAEQNRIVAAAKIPRWVPTYRYYMSEEERKEKGIDGPMHVLKRG